MHKKPLCRHSALLIVLAIGLLTACQGKNDSDTTTPSSEPLVSRAAVDRLDQTTANSRKSRVSNIGYDITIKLDRDAEDFSGEVKIRFDLTEDTKNSDLSLDFGGGVIMDSAINGQPGAIPYNGFFLTLPAAMLQGGPNTVTIRYSHPYSKDGTGLHHFVDPVDDRTYLYSYLWPYYANRMFPAFDQPNLKARFTLNVDAPKDWIVVSMGDGTVNKTNNDGISSWHFTTTPLMTTYAFSLHAGPYQVWEAEADGLPMRLMARQSLAEFVAVEEWFDVTRRGLRYFGEYFGIPYPYGKYDQLLVPDFAIGAMENIAAVTFNEQYYVQRQPSDRSQREARAGTILHEMAHMWFGNLVTHHWWNGMWLNESFATQMSTLAKLATTEFDDTWHGFFTSAKQRAYRADSRVTTHPIEMPINNTIDFFLVFDAITYQKGASVLKQLAHYVGEENYRKGVSAYLKANSYGNTELDHFIAFQTESSGKNISAWAQQWLYQPGFNTLSVASQCEAEKLQSLKILQTAPEEFPVLRSHQVDVALYTISKEGQLLPATVLQVTVQGSETNVRFPPGLACPALINPNHNDWTLAQIKLDNLSIETLHSQLANVPQPLARSMFLAALYQRAMEGEMSLSSYLGLAMHLAESEEVIRIQQQISNSVITTVRLMQRLRPETDEALATWLPRLEEQFLQKAATAISSDLKRTWFKTFLGVAWSEAGIATMRELLDGTQKIPGLDITADLRWKLLTRLAGSAQPDTEALLAAERAADNSDFGVKNNLTAMAARPDLAVKKRWLAELQKPTSLTGLSRQRAVMAGLFPADQTHLQEKMLDEILDSLPVLSHKVDPYFLSSYVIALLRPICTPVSAEMMQTTIRQSVDQLDSTALRFLLEAQQADAECLALRNRQHPN